jgi:hypothetical protein
MSHVNSIKPPRSYCRVAEIADVQNHVSPHTIDIDKVGVKNISYPIVVLDKFNGTQHTVACINMYVNLPHRHKGTHMSRFIEIPERTPPGRQPQEDRPHPGGDPAAPPRPVGPHRDDLSLLHRQRRRSPRPGA